MEEDIDFIRGELLPEMVHNRCFCEKGSREFVEFDSAEVEPLEKDSYRANYSSYRAKVVVLFSGEPQTFRVLIKLLPEDTSIDPNLALAFGGFLNEEILCNKGILQYGHDFFPKYYVADMGRYDRPVIVVEDLEKNGFHRILGRAFDMEEGKAVIDLIGRFHGKGYFLKETKFAVFREFYAKFEETVLIEACREENRSKYKEFTRKVESTIGDEEDLAKAKTFFNTYNHCKDRVMQSTLEKSSTICQGFLLRENLWFKKRDEDNSEKIEVKIQDWQWVRHGASSLDLATILVQCQGEHWDELIDVYATAIHKEHSTASVESVRQDLVNFGFFYVPFIMSPNQYQSLDLKNMMKYVKDN